MGAGFLSVRAHQLPHREGRPLCYPAEPLDWGCPAAEQDKVGGISDGIWDEGVFPGVYNVPGV